MISVIGLGKIGLPFAVKCALSGMQVTGCDANAEVVRLVNQGSTPFKGEPDLDSKLSEVVASSALVATTDTRSAVAESSVVIVLVPVYVDRHGVPDYVVIDNVTAEIGQSIKLGTLVSYETTLPVGTTRNRFTQAVADLSGLSPGKEFFVSFSPERVSSGSVFRDFAMYPKLVGGINEESTVRAKEFYENVLTFDARQDLRKPNGVWALASSEEAELAKLAETTYRDVNIGLANQFAKFAEKIGANIYNVIEACNSQPYSHIHTPGVSVGGHCIPVYPHMYLQGDPDASVVSAARAANKSMPRHLVDRVESALGSLQNKKILILGLAYRGGVKESAFSGAWDLVESIHSKGGTPVVHDPLYTDDELAALGLVPHSLGDHCDAAILHTSHEQYKDLGIDDLSGVQFMADGRNFISNELKSKIKTYVVGQG